MRVYSPTFDYLYDIRMFQRMQIVRKYIGKSMLTLVIAASDDAAYYLQKNGWIVDEEPFIIKHINQGINNITVTAYGGHQLLTQRITVPTNYAIEKTGSADAVVKHFIDQSKRGLPLSTAAVQGGMSISDQSRLKNLGDEVVRVLTGAGRGEKFDIVDGEVVFDTYLGVDRSRGNPFDNPPVVFDLKYKNINEYTYIEDATVEQTTVYVGGKGEGIEREIIVTGNETEGIDRVEVFVDARDVEQGDMAKLTARAAQATIPMAQTVSAEAVADANLVYGIDYQLGDIVTTNVPVKQYIQNDNFYDPVETTIQVNQRITEITISREGGGETIDLTFGELPITQTQVQRLRAEVAQLKSVEGGNSGGGDMYGPGEGSVADGEITVFDGDSGKTVKGGGWKLYASLDQLGLTSPAALADICAAMSGQSMIVLVSSDILASDMPHTSYGAVTIKKINNYRCPIEWQFAGYSTTFQWPMFVSNWRISDGLSGWRQLAVGDIRTGTCTLNDATWTSVSFTPAMSGIPRVALTSNQNIAGVRNGKVRNVTATGFEAMMGGTSTGATTFDYIAISV